MCSCLPSANTITYEMLFNAHHMSAPCKCHTPRWTWTHQHHTAHCDICTHNAQSTTRATRGWWQQLSLPAEAVLSDLCDRSKNKQHVQNMRDHNAGGELITKASPTSLWRVNRPHAHYWMGAYTAHLPGQQTLRSIPCDIPALSQVLQTILCTALRAALYHLFDLY